MELTTTPTMRTRSLATIGPVTACLALGLALCLPGSVQAAERPPELVRSAPIIPWAKSVGENRYRSPRNYDDTLTYYRKVLRGGWDVSWRKIINVSGIRAQHIKNNKKDGRWEGLNIYEYKGATFIYIVFSDLELERIAKGAEGKASKKKRRKRKKR